VCAQLFKGGAKIITDPFITFLFVLNCLSVGLRVDYLRKNNQSLLVNDSVKNPIHGSVCLI
jgi:hypothetical protein